MGDQGSDYVIKYAGDISIYYKKKKIGLIGIHRTNKGEWIQLQSSKHPKYKNVPIILTRSNIEFKHRRAIKNIDEEKKEYQGAYGFIDFMEAEYIASEKSLSKEALTLLVNESSEVRGNPEILKQLISEKKIQTYVEAFKNKRKDSSDYKNAVNFLKDYFDDNNKIDVDV